VSVICLVEHDAAGVLPATKRALTFARGLAAAFESPLVSMSVGALTEAALDDLSRYGVSSTCAASSSRLGAYAPAAWARSLLELSESRDGSAVVAAATDRGNEVLAHAGALSEQPVAANCLSFARAELGSITLTRYRWAGTLLEEAELEGRPALVTVVPDAAPDVPSDAAGPVTETAWEPTLDDAAFVVQVTGSEARPPGSTSLGEARVVVGGGRGVGSAEGFAPLEELADLLGGVVGVSRVVTSNGWRPHSQQVGQTGTKIAPNLYLACGISGAIQHLAGCRGAKTVVAINTDGEAPIMRRADYAVIGDVSTIVPALIAAIRERPAR
jgi:electron transfer flavoprotein alpha subunit